MSLLDSKVYVGLSIKMFADMFKAYVKENKLEKFNLDREVPLLENNNALTLTGHLEVRLNLPEFSLRQRNNGDVYTALTLSGNVDLKVSSPTAESPVLHSFPIAADLRVGLTLKPQGNGNPPKIGLFYNGIENLDAPINEIEMELAVQASGVVTVINELEIDILNPLIEGMETVLFFGQDSSTFPARDQYQINLRPMKGVGSNSDGYGLFVALPGDNISASNIPSFIPSYSDVCMVLSETMIDAMVANAKSELQSFIEGMANTVKVKTLTAQAENDKIRMYAKIKETEHDIIIEITTDVFLKMFPGSTKIGLKAKIDPEYDFPWYIDFLKFFIVGEDELLEETLPNLAQNYVEDIANGMLEKLSNSINLDGLSVGGIDVEVYPQELKLEDGKIELNIQVHSYKTVERLAVASHSPLRDKFILFTMQSGRQFQTKHLAQFMRDGLIEMPGYHEVDGEYIRANPDDTEANNLLSRFGR